MGRTRVMVDTISPGRCPSANFTRVTLTKQSGINGSSFVGGLVGHGTLTQASDGPKGARALGFCLVGGSFCFISIPNCNCTGISGARQTG